MSIASSLSTRAVRPTSGRAREAIFSTVEAMGALSGAVVVDLYAGTASLGIEALSRGAVFAVFVEKEPALARDIRREMQRLGVGSSTAVICSTVELCWSALEKAVARISRMGEDRRMLIFADPPWSEHPEASLLVSIANSDVVSAQSVVVIVSSSKQMRQIEDASMTLALVKSAKYGDTAVRYFERRS